ncbi:MAG: hypothetical protein JW944_03165, partial [Deltaproteobacteria bacterium]|nr:hypothetical protein [Deltaproteobacteria bacterium]
GGINKAKWMEAWKQLSIGTIGGEIRLVSSQAITPSNPPDKKQDSDYGSAEIQGFVADKAIIFVDRCKRILREYLYDYNTDAFQSNSLSVLSEHILNDGNGIVDIAYQKKQDSVIWCVLEDGTLGALTYMPEQQVVGWHKHTLGGIAEVESICVIPGTYGHDEVWMSVKREINRNTVRYIELMYEDEEVKSTSAPVYTPISFGHIGTFTSPYTAVEDVFISGSILWLAVATSALGGFTVDAFGNLTSYNVAHAGIVGNGVFCSGDLVFIASSTTGIRSYRPVYGSSSPLDSDYPGGTGYDVHGDSGNLLFFANGPRGLECYSYDKATGILSHEDNDDRGGSARGVWWDGTYVFLANYDRGIETYTVDAGGNLTWISNTRKNLTSYPVDIWGYGNFVFVADADGNIDSYSKNAGVLTYVASGYCEGASPLDVFANQNYVYGANNDRGLIVFSYDEQGNFTKEYEHDPNGIATGVMADNNFVYLSHKTPTVGGVSTYVVGKK